MYCIRACLSLTRVCHADADVSSLELRVAKGESLLQAFDGAKLDVAEALGSVVELVLDDTNAGNFAAGKEVLNVTLGHFEGEVAQVSSVRGLVGERKLLADGVALESGRA